jgi:hypothetical protein
MEDRRGHEQQQQYVSFGRVYLEQLRWYTTY